MVKRLHCFWVLMCFFVASAVAQVTTSGLSGKVVADGEAVIGATIQAVHLPSGTKYGGVSNVDGRFTIQGMRVGGPYKVTISYVGYETEVYNNVQLALGESKNIQCKMKENVNELSEVAIIGKGGNGQAGAATNFSREKIEAVPSVNRSVYDVVKLSPMASTNKTGGITFSGANNRYNSFQIDGTVSNDVFGLAGTGTNGGQTDANPISLDAIEQIQVAVSPFDVRQSGFTGGAINAITKSGTNKFQGSAYLFYTDESMYSTWSQTLDKKSELTDETTKTYGATFGGPIIKDKLFFFVSGEHKKKEYPASYYPGVSDGYVSVAEAKAIADKYKEITGVSESYGARNITNEATNLMARLDWNINDNHKLMFRYQLNDSYKEVYSPSNTTYYFNNSGYKMSNTTNSFVAELNSHLSDNLYNEARLGAVYVRDNRDVDYMAPNISISNVGGSYDVTNNSWSQGKKSVYLGTEYSSGANKLDQDVYTFEDNLSWYKGDHTFTFGTHNEFYKMKNLFIQGSTGAFYFNSLNDFLNDNPWKFSYGYTDPEIVGSTTWAGTLKAGQIGVYAQDKFAVNDRLTLTYGLRLDIPVFFNSPMENPTFNASEYALKNNVKVGDVPSGKLLWSPRVGFRYYTDESHNTLIRGGVGMFTGRVPFVWMSNAWNNTGMEKKSLTVTKGTIPTMNDYKENGLNGCAETALQGGKMGNPDICTIDKDFKYPQVLRTNLAVEQQLPYGVKMTLEGLYSKTLNNVFFENLALTDEGKKVYAVSSEYPNSAATYYTANTGSYYSIVNLKNTNKGYTYSLSAKLEKSFDFGLDLMANYTFGHSYSVNDGTSSVAYSNWKYNYSKETNSSSELSYSLFDMPHRVMASVSYHTPAYYNGSMNTEVSLIYNGYSGQRYCLTMNETADFNGDTQKGNSLLYLPTDEELAKMTFDSEANRAKFAEFLSSDRYAKNHRGQYAERYSNSAPWENHFDLHLAQNFFYNKERGSKVQISFDVLNVGNMLNHDWGSYYSATYSRQVLKVTSLSTDAEGNKTPTYSWQGNTLSKSDFSSRWHAQVGLKVTF